ncbi:hypothetical protein BDV96DRAFT_567327 [Lophiotrema nucula]|uniref:Uncharacterized protein n=1 Tax=Lophiotrema nucula TaxID=690887 RepID=A0A6A5ZM31_9PLEO|nr:hypothetical protein BDV96DRAFT_567327 [Lophiotrema nucula]
MAFGLGKSSSKSSKTSVSSDRAGPHKLAERMLEDYTDFMVDGELDSEQESDEEWEEIEPSSPTVEKMKKQKIAAMDAPRKPEAAHKKHVSFKGDSSSEDDEDENLVENTRGLVGKYHPYGKNEKPFRHLTRPSRSRGRARAESDASVVSETLFDAESEGSWGPAPVQMLNKKGESFLD